MFFATLNCLVLQKGHIMVSTLLIVEQHSLSDILGIFVLNCDFTILSNS